MYSLKQNHRNLTTRINKIQGQLRGVQNMIDRDAYCVDVIIQTSAIKNALASLENVMIQHHLTSCCAHQCVDPQNRETMIQEIIRIYQLKQK